MIRRSLLFSFSDKEKMSNASDEDSANCAHLSASKNLSKKLRMGTERFSLFLMFTDLLIKNAK